MQKPNQWIGWLPRLTTAADPSYPCYLCETPFECRAGPVGAGWEHSSRPLTVAEVVSQLNEPFPTLFIP